jgi:CTP synthase (UTP-ammonia lyase)
MPNSCALVKRTRSARAGSHLGISPARIEAMRRARIAIVGDFDPGYISHRETGVAIEDSGQRLGIAVDYQWVATDAVASAGTGMLAASDGLWAAPGAPYRSLEGALAGIRFARERGVPFFGT